MNNPTATADRLSRELAAGVPCDLLAGLPDELLLQATGAIERLGRRVDALRVTAAAEIADRSRTELGSAGLSATKGCRNGADLVERVTLVSGRTAADRIRLGTETRQGTSLTGEELPARFPTVAAALAAGDLGVDAASAIVTGLLPALPVAGTTELLAAELELVGAATGTGPAGPGPDGADEIRRQAKVWQVILDQDGARPLEERSLRRRGFSAGTAQDGLMVGRYAFMPDVYAKLQRVFDAYIFTRTAPSFYSDEELDAHQREKDPRSWTQQRHDVFAAIIDLISRSSEVPTIGGAPPTVLVSARAEDLSAGHGVGPSVGKTAGHGVGHIDGIDIPVSMRTVRQYACTGGTQLVVIGANGAINALGTEQRLFNRQQRRAINLRDGGCIIPGCTIPAYWTEIHHVIPDAAGGPTHTSNGVSLCWYHHRTIETSGWLIRMIAGAPQVKAPPWLETNAKWRPASKSPTQLTRILEKRTAGTAGQDALSARQAAPPAAPAAPRSAGLPTLRPSGRPELSPAGQSVSGVAGRSEDRPSGQPPPRTPGRPQPRTPGRPQPRTSGRPQPRPLGEPPP
ncbi:HNH endonuclease signature motif containing protein [Homoserinimonas sp. OAct 916]|uniref:HNH endonuclease signature motif containing protein n=1 Tax=Homoserinimonas sp. OAct 916 TaxID=2211450 RepID=UPI000DBE5156|nr:HNH endonuclease signature motif containing protein [Homoserinimonas sp. OAct 916]